MTPEGKVKKKIKEVLDKYGVYYFMPVQMGYGPSGLDFHCGVKVRHIHIGFYVEAKDFEEEPTKRQVDLIKKLRAMNAKVFVIDDDISLTMLEDYLHTLQTMDKQ